MGKKARKVVYYQSLSDDFVKTKVGTQEIIGKDFPFVHKNPFWRLLSFLLYYGVAVPVVFLYSHLVLGLRIHNKQALRRAKGQGFFLYGNHTHHLDVFLPPLLAFPHRVSIVANPDAVSIKGLKTIVQMLGGTPVPKDISALGSFSRALRERCNKKQAIIIYPEAKIWPYYHGVRPVPDTSFKYPVDFGAPVIGMFTAYRERRGPFPPGRDVYLSDPFYPDASLPPKLQRRDLHDKVYSFMKDCAQLSGFAYIEYRPAPKEPARHSGQEPPEDEQKMPKAE